MQEFMKDRYGVDDLTIALGGISIILALIGTIAKLGLLSWIALALVALALVRAFSKNIDARRSENLSYLQFASKLPVIGPHFDAAARGGAGARPAGSTSPDMARAKRTAERMWRERGTTLFFRCKTCGSILSVPRGKGHIRVTCPKCGTKVEKNS